MSDRERASGRSVCAPARPPAPSGEGPGSIRPCSLVPSTGLGAGSVRPARGLQPAGGAAAVPSPLGIWDSCDEGRARPPARSTEAVKNGHFCFLL